MGSGDACAGGPVIETPGKASQSAIRVEGGRSVKNGDRPGGHLVGAFYTCRGRRVHKKLAARLKHGAPGVAGCQFCRDRSEKLSRFGEGVCGFSALGGSTIAEGPSVRDYGCTLQTVQRYVERGGKTHCGAIRADDVLIWGGNDFDVHNICIKRLTEPNGIARDCQRHGVIARFAEPVFRPFSAGGAAISHHPLKCAHGLIRIG